MDPVDWQTGKNSAECIKHMLDNNVNCDIKFKVGEYEEIIKAHKLILSMRSAVFDRMFNGSLCESQEGPIIPDVTSAAFKMLLRYCYYESLDIKDDVALSVLYASTKYMLPLLEEAARKKLIETLSGPNIWDIYEYGINVGDTTLLEGCQKFFQGNIKPVKDALQAEAFLNIPHRVLLKFRHINDQAGSSKENTGNHKNNSGICISEIELFKACNAWAEAECVRQEIDATGTEKRRVLGECLSLIRFPTMLLKDLVTVVYPTGILTQPEIVNLGQYIHRDEGVERQVDFPSRERQFVVKSPQGTAPRVGYETSAISIESAVRVVLSRLWILDPGSYKVILSDLTSDVTWSMKCDTEFQGHVMKYINEELRFLFFLDIKPQPLEPDTKYSLSVQRTKHSSYPDQTHFTKWLYLKDLLPLKEVQLTPEPFNYNIIHALTLCLV